MVFLEIKNNNWRVIVVELVNMFNRLILLLLWGIKWRRKINLWGNLWNIRNLMGIFWDLGCRIKMLTRLVSQGYDQCFVFCFIFIYVFGLYWEISTHIIAQVRPKAPSILPHFCHELKSSFLPQFQAVLIKAHPVPILTALAAQYNMALFLLLPNNLNCDFSTCQ